MPIGQIWRMTQLVGRFDADVYYRGRRLEDGTVRVHRHEPGEGGVPLSPCYNVRCHAPTGFEWGYRGSGPAQLALAICVDACRGWTVRRMATGLYQVFKEQVISHIAVGDWCIMRADVREWMSQYTDCFGMGGEATGPETLRGPGAMPRTP